MDTKDDSLIEEMLAEHAARAAIASLDELDKPDALTAITSALGDLIEQHDLHPHLGRRTNVYAPRLMPDAAAAMVPTYCWSLHFLMLLQHVAPEAEGVPVADHATTTEVLMLADALQEAIGGDLAVSHTAVVLATLSVYPAPPPEPRPYPRILRDGRRIEQAIPRPRDPDVPVPLDRDAIWAAAGRWNTPGNHLLLSNPVDREILSAFVPVPAGILDPELNRLREGLREWTALAGQLAEHTRRATGPEVS